MRIAAFFVACLLLAITGCAGRHGEMSMSLADSIDQMVAKAFPDPLAPGCAVLVRMDGNTIVSRGYGLANLETGELNTPETNFRLASITKQFTAAAVLRLVEQRKVALEYSMPDIFPGFPEYGAAIQVRHLLGHTSGLPDYEDLMDKSSTEQIRDAGVLAILGKQAKGDFPPGEKYAYSNSGYATLAMTVEARAEKPFADYLAEEFFVPLGMTDSVAFEDGKSVVARRAHGHRREEVGPWFRADQSTTSAVLGDGGVYTSVTGYGKWADAWFDGKVLTPAHQALAWTPGTLNDGSRTDYGFGWRVEDVDGIARVHHTGSTTGFNNCARLVPSRRLCVVILSNRNGPEPEKLARAIEELALAEK